MIWPVVSSGKENKKLVIVLYHETIVASGHGVLEENLTICNRLCSVNLVVLYCVQEVVTHYIVSYYIITNSWTYCMK